MEEEVVWLEGGSVREREHLLGFQCRLLREGRIRGGAFGVKGRDDS